MRIPTRYHRALRAVFTQEEIDEVRLLVAKCPVWLSNRIGAWAFPFRTVYVPAVWWNGTGQEDWRVAMLAHELQHLRDRRVCGWRGILSYEWWRLKAALFRKSLHKYSPWENTLEIELEVLREWRSRP